MGLARAGALAPVLAGAAARAAVAASVPGLGLDEKALEAIQKWKFRPRYKDSKPVTVAAIIEVNFRLM